MPDSPSDLPRARRGREQRIGVYINGIDPGTGRCVIADCGASIAGGYLMCAPHWSKVPLHLAATLQDAMDEWRAGVLTLGLLRDIQWACVDAVEAR